MQLSMFSSEEPLARAFRSPDSERDWTIRAATWHLSILRWLTDTAPAGSFGKMSLASCRRAKDGILVPSSEGWQNSGMGGPTEFWTLNTSEHACSPAPFPNDGDVCSLSDILETGDLPRRFFLTPKACAGILRRAVGRGKDLPPPLQAALQAVAGSAPIWNATAA